MLLYYWLPKHIQGLNVFKIYNVVLLALLTFNSVRSIPIYVLTKSLRQTDTQIERQTEGQIDRARG